MQKLKNTRRMENTEKKKLFLRAGTWNESSKSLQIYRVRRKENKQRNEKGEISWRERWFEVEGNNNVCLLPFLLFDENRALGICNDDGFWSLISSNLSEYLWHHSRIFPSPHCSDNNGNKPESSENILKNFKGRTEEGKKREDLFIVRIIINTHILKP